VVTRCFFCGKEVDPDSRNTYRRLQGWNKKGRSGGSDVYLRELLNTYACAGCISAEKSRRASGVSQGQGELF
jgi:hypothetical protein